MYNSNTGRENGNTLILHYFGVLKRHFKRTYRSKTIGTPGSQICASKCTLRQHHVLSIVNCRNSITYLLLTYSMEQSPSWAANRSSASQEIPRILWNLKVNYRTHKWPSPVPILSHIYPGQVPHTTSWRSILILSSNLRLGLPSDLFPSGFPTKPLYTSLFSPIRAICPAHLNLLDFMSRTILGEKYTQYFITNKIFHRPF